MGTLLPFFLVYVAGILVALLSSGNLPYAIPLALIAAAFFTITKSKKNRTTTWVLLTCLFFFGWLAPGLPEYFRSTDHILYHLEEGQRAEITGNLIDAPSKFPKRVVYLVDLTEIRYGETPAIPVSGRARITLYSQENSLQPGDVLRISGVRLKRPRNFKNPGRFDYEHYMESKGINVIGGVSKPEAIKKTGAIALSVFAGLRYAARQNMLQTIDRHLNWQEAALLKAMLLGETQSLPEDIKEDYRAAGIAHLMAVSGLHIGFVAFAVYFIAYPLVFYLFHKYFPAAAQTGKARKTAVLITLLSVLFYAILVGVKVSALRAGMMACIFLLAVLVNRISNLFNALMLAAFALLLWNPKAILEPGFQLSFMAVFSILFVLHFIRKEEKDNIDRMIESSPFVEFIKGTAWVSLAANLATLPIVAMHFNRISLIGFLLNMVVVPFAAILIPLALFALALGLLWQPLVALFMPVVSSLLKIFLVVPHFFASLPYAFVYLTTPPQFWLLLYYATLFGTVYWFHRYRKDKRQLDMPSVPWLKSAGYGLGFVALWTVIWMVWPRFPQWPTDKLSISILDVGSGESIFVEFPNQQNMLIDGGGFYGDHFDVGRFVVAPTLWHRGVSKIDYIIATHSDNDHINGLESLLDLIPVGHLLYREMAIKDTRLETFLQKALARNATPLRLQAGKLLQVGEVKITALHPDANYIRQEKQKGRKRVGNSLSMVLRLDYREFSMLFTADIGKNEEHYLIKTQAALHADFLKAPHHGSRFSNTGEFIQAVQPSAVFFSSGYHNSFHHPHPSIVQRYENFGAKIWRTDLDGSITITTDGYNHHVQEHENL